jgi:hypothetical protein
MIIPRDPSFRLPPMSLQNVTSMAMKNDSPSDRRLSNFHSMDFNPTSSSFALHLEVHPLSSMNLSYLMINRFDRSPILNGSLSQIDGWSVFCPSTINESVSTHFFSNNETFGHRSLIFGLRELNSSRVCSTPIVTPPPLTDHQLHFSANYELRLYTSSACSYFDEQTEEWKSDGLTLGPLNNHFETQCFSKHI